MFYLENKEIWYMDTLGPVINFLSIMQNILL